MHLYTRSSSLALVLTVALGTAASAQITMRRPPTQTTTTAMTQDDRVDLMVISTGPAPLSGPALGAKLGELGLKPNTVLDGEPLRLTIVSPRKVPGTLGLNEVGTVSAATVDGWAAVYGGVIARFNADPGGRYLVDFSVGDLPGYSLAGTRRFVARIYDDEAAKAQSQDLTLPRGPQHVVMIVEATGTRPFVSLGLWRDAALSGSLVGTLTAAGAPAPFFVFYSVEISKLK